MEDLWAFNEEEVARAIFDCSTPVISAVGHETDTTIADFVADLRAPTPSAAAELAVYDLRMTMERMRELEGRMGRILRQKVELWRSRLKAEAIRLEHLASQNADRGHRQQLMDLEERIGTRDAQDASCDPPPDGTVCRTDEGAVAAGEAEPGICLCPDGRREGSLKRIHEHPAGRQCWRSV